MVLLLPAAVKETPCHTCMRTGFGAFSLVIFMASFRLASLSAAATVLLSSFCSTPACSVRYLTRTVHIIQRVVGVAMRADANFAGVVDEAYARVPINCFG